jgi:hypothetical protein
MKFCVNYPLVPAILLSVSLFSAIGCKKSSSSNSSGNFTAKIDGSNWAGNIPETGELIASAGIFELGGIQYKNGDSTAIALTFSAHAHFSNPLNSSDSTDAVDISYVDLKTKTAYDGGTTGGNAIITITSYDSTAGKIAGQFSGVVYNITGGSDSLVITGGVFTSTFVSQ